MRIKPLKHLSILCWCLLLSSQNLCAQEKYTVSGYISDSESGENLIGATVQIKSKGTGTVTNVYGFYSLTLAEGSYTLVYSYLGYDSKKLEVDLQDDKRLNVELSPSSLQTDEVVVTGERADENVKSADVGTVDLSMEKVKTLPVLFGEADVLKTLQLLPGVQSAGEGNSGFYVRGGGPDQNLILLDEAVVYNTGHLFGFFSVFNSDALKNTTLIKGGMPAEYGGRLSSVVDVTMKDGNMKKFHAAGGVGLIASRLTLEGPLVKDKSSFMISGRRTYVDVLLQPIEDEINLSGNSYFFYDLNTKLNYKFSDKDRVFFSGYFGRDVFSFESESGAFAVDLPWGNSTATLRWNHLFSDKLFMNVSAIYNDYNFEVGINQQNLDVALLSGIRDYNLKTDFSWFPNVRNKVKFGVNYTYHTFTPSTASGQTEEGVDINTDSVNQKFGHEFGAYIQDQYDLSDRIRVNAGLRLSGFQLTGPYTYFRENEQTVFERQDYDEGEPVKTYFGLEPRISLRYTLNPTSSLKASFTKTNQYIHLVTNSNTTLPSDIWVPSSQKVEPQIGYQYSAGYFRNFADNKFETSVEFYYKRMYNQIEYRDGYIPAFGRELERDFVFGSGESFGMEVFINKKLGKLTGWIGYTLSKTTRFFPDLETQVFPSTYDRRHDLSVVASYELSKRWTISSTFVYGSGNTTTIPERWYFVAGRINYDYGPRNGYRLAPYHRLDLSAVLKGKENKKFSSNWVFAVYNVYSRLNPYFIYFENEGNILNGNFNIQPKQVSLFPIIPSITWNFEF